MSKRTNLIFRVQLVKYAWVNVEAHDEDESVEIAEHIDFGWDEQELFDDSDIEVYAVEKGGVEPDFEMDTIYTKDDGEMSYDEYIEEVENGNTEEDNFGWDMTNQTSLQFRISYGNNRRKSDSVR